MVGVPLWQIVIVCVVAAMLFRGAVRSRGWNRAVCIVLAVVVLLGAFWFMMVQAGEQVQRQEGAVSGRGAVGLGAGFCRQCFARPAESRPAPPAQARDEERPGGVTASRLR